MLSCLCCTIFFVIKVSSLNIHWVSPLTSIDKLFMWLKTSHLQAHLSSLPTTKVFSVYIKYASIIRKGSSHHFYYYETIFIFHSISTKRSIVVIFPRLPSFHCQFLYIIHLVITSFIVLGDTHNILNTENTTFPSWTILGSL